MSLHENGLLRLLARLGRCWSWQMTYIQWLHPVNCRHHSWKPRKPPGSTGLRLLVPLDRHHSWKPRKRLDHVPSLMTYNDPTRLRLLVRLAGRTMTLLDYVC